METIEITALLEGMGFTSNAVLQPSPETRQRYVIRIYTTKGWIYLRLPKGEAASEKIAAWAGQYEPAEKQ